MPTVVPDPAKLADTAKALLAAAGDHPERVRTVTAGGRVAFDVPDELVAPTEPAEPTEPVAAQPATTPEPPKRNASRDDWAEFLSQAFDLDTKGKDRADLLAEYDALTAKSSDS